MRHIFSFQFILSINSIYRILIYCQMNKAGSQMNKAGMTRIIKATTSINKG